MAELDFNSLWGNEQAEAPKKKLEEAKDSNEYIEIKKEYQQYIKFNQELQQQRKEANHDMIQLVKDSKEGKPIELLEDSLKIISLLMRDKAFHTQATINLKGNPHTRAE